MAALHIIYATTSGHTEYVVDTLIAYLAEHAPDITVEKQRAEQVTPEDMKRGDVLLLASGTWNTGSVEGQLSPQMHALLKERAVAVDLGGKKVALIALGDDRYHFTVGALTHLEEFVQTHNGQIIGTPLRIINEPYGQEKAVREWGGILHSQFSILNS